MTQTPNPPAGWYPQDNQERWWDGTGWSDNFRPLGSGQIQQPGQPMMAAGYPNTYQQVQQPGYAQPTYGQPQPYLTQPVEKSHTARNILIVFAVLFLLFVGGCIAVVAIVGGKVNDAVNDDSVGGPNNPLTITEGKAFEVNGFEYADGWTIVGEPVSQTWHVDNLKVTNNRGKADRLDVKLTLLNGSEVVATSFCTVGDGIDKIPEDITVTVECVSSDPLPGLRQDHDQRHPLAPASPAGTSAAAARGTSPAGRRSRPGRRPAGSRGCRPRSSPRARRTPTRWSAPARSPGEPVVVQVGEVERGGHVAAAVRRDRQQGCGDRPGALVGDRDARPASPAARRVQHAGDQHVARTAVADRVDRGEHLVEGAWSCVPARKSSSKWLGVMTSACGTTVSRMNSGMPGPHEHARGRRRPSPGRSSRPRPG